MPLTLRAATGRAAYAILFTLVLPAGLMAWARALDPHVTLPVYQSTWAGVALATAGFLIWVAGVVSIVMHGQRPAMNALPPARLETSGIDALVAHPTFVGWVLACAGVAFASGSAAGLWIVTPIVALTSAALVLGLEGPNLRRQFWGAATTGRPWLSLPIDQPEAPTTAERIAFCVVVLLPWLVAYYIVKSLGVPPDAIDVRFDLETRWPVWLWTVPIYVSAYLAVPLAAFLVPTRAGLRTFAVQGLVSTAVITIVYLTVPFITPFRPFERAGILGWLLEMDRQAAGPPVAAWPSFHVVWAMFVAEALATRSRAWGALGWAWAVALAVSCVTTGMHATVDIVAAVAFYLVLRRPVDMWRGMLDGAERLASSWRATRIGPARILNHGVYAGAAAAVGVMGISALAGVAALPAVAIMALFSLAGAALWTSPIERTPLLRTFGYFGAILGVAASAIIMRLAGQPASLVIAAAAAMAPWIVAIGRLQCLVQGCCHGAPTDARSGIRVWNAHSRVVSLAGLGGQSIHATPLYSIVGNVVIGVLLLRLWRLHAPVWFVVGFYLILAGLARFVEEAYRGEPQTRRWLGLPMSQVMALVSVAVGVPLATMGGMAAPAATMRLITPAVILTAAAIGIVYWIAMGVDFPESRRRFSRLAG